MLKVESSVSSKWGHSKMRNFSKQTHDVYFLRGTRNTGGPSSVWASDMSTTSLVRRTMCRWLCDVILCRYCLGDWSGGIIADWIEFCHVDIAWEAVMSTKLQFWRCNRSCNKFAARVNLIAFFRTIPGGPRTLCTYSVILQCAFTLLIYHKMMQFV